MNLKLCFSIAKFVNDKKQLIYADDFSGMALSQASWAIEQSDKDKNAVSLRKAGQYL